LGALYEVEGQLQGEVGLQVTRGGTSVYGMITSSRYGDVSERLLIDDKLSTFL